MSKNKIGLVKALVSNINVFGVGSILVALVGITFALGGDLKTANAAVFIAVALATLNVLLRRIWRK